MFKKLHLQLTFLGASISSFILVAMSFFCLSFSEAETREAYFSDFQKNISVLIGYLEGQSTLSHSWLSQICTETHFKIDIRDNGHALIFDSLNPRPSDDALFAQARQIARDRYMMLEEAFSGQSVFSSHKEFSFFPILRFRRLPGQKRGRLEHRRPLPLRPPAGQAPATAALFPACRLRRDPPAWRLLLDL